MTAPILDPPSGPSSGPPSDPSSGPSSDPSSDPPSDPATARPDLDALADLEEQRAFLLQSLRDLEREHAAGDLDDDDYRSLKDDYTARAAAVLRQIEAGRAALVAPRARSRWRAVAVAAAVVVAGAVGGELLARASGERVAGESASGSIRETSSGTLARARALYDEGKLVEALKLFDSVLKKDPGNPMALAYRGWIVHLAGLSDEGLGYVDRAIAADPAYPFAHFFKGLILLQARKDAAGAIPELETFLRLGPPPAMVPTVQGILKAARDAAGGTPAVTSATTTTQA